MNNINKLGNKFSLTMIVLTLGVLMLASTSFADIEFSQLSEYDLDNHYKNPTKDNVNRTGALKRGTKAPLMKMVITRGEGVPEDQDVELSLLSIVVEPGTAVTQVEVWQDTDDNGTYEKRVGYSSVPDLGEATIDNFSVLNPPQEGTYIITGDIASDAASVELDMGIFGIDGDFLGLVSWDDNEVPYASVDEDTIVNPDGMSRIDASEPRAESGTYYSGSKVLEIEFIDYYTGTNHLQDDSRIDVIHLEDRDADGTSEVYYDVKLSAENTAGTVIPMIEIRDIDSRVGLTGATLIYWLDLNDDGIVDLDEAIEIRNGVELNEQPEGFPAEPLQEINTNKLYIKLTSAQASSVANAITEDKRVWLSGGVTKNDTTARVLSDYVFNNSITTSHEVALDEIGDNTSPQLLEPVRFDSQISELELRFNETINANTPNLDLNNIFVKNYELKTRDGKLVVVEDDYIPDDNEILGKSVWGRFVFEKIGADVVVRNKFAFFFEGDYHVAGDYVDVNPDATYRFVLVQEESVNLSGADFIEGYYTSLTLTLTPSQRDILRGNHPQLVINSSAIVDISGNQLGDGIDNDGDGSIDESGELEDDDIDNDGDGTVDEDGESGFISVNVNVTPISFSSVDSMYNGNPQAYNDNLNYPYPYLELKFSENISTVNPDRIIVTNEDGESPFSVNPINARFETEEEPGYTGIINYYRDGNVLKMYLSMGNKNRIAEWQNNANITELHIRLTQGAVSDQFGRAIPEMTVSERIIWVEDITSPVVRGEEYRDSNGRLELEFNEHVNVETVNSSKITLEADGGEVDGSSFNLNGATFLKEDSGGRFLRFKLTDSQINTIAGWDGAGATGLIANILQVTIEDNDEGNNVITAWAVKDLVGSTAKGTLVDGTTNRTSLTWYKDNVIPQVDPPARYSTDTGTLTIKFTEAISSGSVDVSKIKVHDANESPMSLGTSQFNISGSYLRILNLSASAQTTIETANNPQFDVGSGAVEDLSGNAVPASNNNSIVIDVGGPDLTNGTYVHISVENDVLVNVGELTLNFDEIVNVGGEGATNISLDEIELSAGNNNIILSEDIANVITTTDGTTVKIRITDDDTVGEISSWGRDYSTLYVTLNMGAVEDLAGNENTTTTQALSTWTKDTREPVFSASPSYYIHNEVINGIHYARLVLQFDEAMDTRFTFVNTDNIAISNSATGGNIITLTEDEIEPGQEFSTEIKFNLTQEHRNMISTWGEPKFPWPELSSTAVNDDFLNLTDDATENTNRRNEVMANGATGGKGKNELYLFLAGGAVQDPAGNTNAPFNARVNFAKANSTNTDDIPGDERRYNPENVPTEIPEGEQPLDYYSTWEKDLRKPEFVSASYNANTKVLTVKFDEKMDVNPANYVKTKYLIRPKHLTIRGINLAGATPVGKDDTTVEVILTAHQDVRVKSAAKPLLLTITQNLPDSAFAIDLAGNPVVPITDREISFTADSQGPVLSKDNTSYVHADKKLQLVFNEGINKNYADINAAKFVLSNQSSGGGFALTQEEIDVVEPGKVVKPEGVVNKIDFMLNSQHWNTVAGWGEMYVQISSGAVKDTSGNAIATATVRLKDDKFNKDTTAPIITLPDPKVTEANVGNVVNITATVTDDIAVNWVRLYYKVGGAVEAFIEMSASGSTYTGQITANAVTNKGLSYYIAAEDHAGNRATTATVNVTVKNATVTLPANYLPVFEVTTGPSKYRMISVPINEDVNSLDLFEPFGTAGPDWKAYHFTGTAANNGYELGHADGGFTFTPSTGAWIGTINPDNALSVTGETANVVSKYEITLRAGWNQIGIPFNFPRNWDSNTIKEKIFNAELGVWEYKPLTNISTEVYYFTGDDAGYSFASTDPTVPGQVADWPGVLEPWIGYWVFSTKEGAILAIDPTTRSKGVIPGTPTAPSAKVTPSWSVKLVAESAGVLDTVKSAGVVLGAVEPDKHDVRDLPMLPGSNVRLSLVTEKGDYLQDMKAPADEMIWQLKASSATEALVKINLDTSAVPSEYRTVLLIDTETEERIDLRGVSSHTYKPNDRTREFKLIVSKKHPEVYAAVPDKSVLLQNYPNPFNPETWVPFKLSEAGEVNVRIYNLAGEMVRKIELGRREAGSYTSRERAAYWDGRNQYGEQVASGVYFYHIQANDFNATKRMVILK